MAVTGEGQRATVVGEHSNAGEAVYLFLMLVVTPAGAAAALILVFQHGVAWFYPALLLLSLLLTTMGVTAGLHRKFTHHSFECKRWLEISLAVLGTSAGQAYFIRWIYVHRLHHRHTDQHGDPHSPLCHGDIPLPRIRGLAHAHGLWMFKRPPMHDDRLVRDLVNDPVMVAIDRYSLLITLAGLLLPGFLSLLYSATAYSFVLGVLWGGLLRLFVIYNLSWGVNSFGHRYGAKLAGQGHSARNNFLLGLATLGDGWHANHHAYAASARHGFGWRQPDLIYLALKAMEKLGWVWNMRLPPDEMVRSWQNDAQTKVK